MYRLLRIIAGARETLLYEVPAVAMPYDWYVKIFTFCLLSDCSKSAFSFFGS
jgi:hypothetical protein